MLEQKKIYSVPNPFFLSDRFVFMLHKDLGSVFIKINSHKKIEDIGIDIFKRLHNINVDEIEKLYDFREATKSEKYLLKHIDDEYLWKLKWKMSK